MAVAAEQGRAGLGQAPQVRGASSPFALALPPPALPLPTPRVSQRPSCSSRCSHPSALFPPTPANNPSACTPPPPVHPTRTHPHRSNIPLGDDRIETYGTSYSSDFHAPFAPQEHLRSPMRNKDLGAAGADEAGLDLKSFYKSAYNRVGGARIKAMLVRMRDRFSAKLGNINDNGFRTRRLFKMYDRGQTGLIHFEDFRMMGESFGMQLDDDSLLALYFVMDPEGSGYLQYEEVVRQLLDDDYFAMYTDKVDNSLATSMRKVHGKMVSDLTRKLSSNIADILLVFESFDTKKTNTISERDFLAGCAALGVVFTGSEKDYIMGLAMKEGSKTVEYRSFCSLFSS